MSAFLNPDMLRTLAANNSGILSDLGTAAGVARLNGEKNKDSRANPEDPSKNPLSIRGLITFITDSPPASTNRFLVEFFNDNPVPVPVPQPSPGESEGGQFGSPNTPINENARLKSDDEKKAEKAAAEKRAGDAKRQASLSLACESASFPGRGIETNIISRTYGPHRKTPTNLVFTDITFTFRCSEDHREKKYFEEWMNRMVIPNSYDFGYYKDYAKTVKIHQLSRGGDAKGISNFYTHSIELEEAYPIRIDEIPLDWNADNAIEKMNVTFTFFKWRNI